VSAGARPRAPDRIAAPRSSAIIAAASAGPIGGTRSDTSRSCSHEDPAEAAQHRRAEERIGLDAEDHLAAAGDHALDQRAVEARRRRATPDLVEHVAEGSAHRRGVAAADANTAHVGLVRDVGRVEARSG